MPEVDPFSLPFAEAIEFFRAKLNMPTASWTDIYNAQHDTAFVVAGAIQDDLLADFKKSIDQAIAQGTGFKAWREQFNRTVKKYGWSYNGGEGWRSRVIYNTNMQGAYMAGRYQQQQALTDQRPFWEYKHSRLVESPRPEHVAWDGLVLTADDPWWQTHYPPNGWGCKCKVYARNQRDLQRSGKTPTQAPELNLQPQTIGIRGPSPRTVLVPEGIDPGFEHAPGASRLP